MEKKEYMWKKIIRNAEKGVSGWKRGPSKTPKGVERDPPFPLEEIEWEPPPPYKQEMGVPTKLSEQINPL